MFFTRPFALILLFLIPFFFWIGWSRTTTGSLRLWRNRLSQVLRLLIVFLIVLSIAGVQSVQGGDELAVVFLVDASDSMTPAQREQSEVLIRDTLKEMGSEEQAAVIVFGAQPLVDRPLSGLTELEPLKTAPSSLNTDFSAAVNLALGLFPTNSARRMVILSDGLATQGDSIAAARLAAAGGVPIDVMTLPRPEAEVEVALIEVDAPERVKRDDLVRIELVVDSTDLMETLIRVFGGQNILHQEVVTLYEGRNNFSLTLPPAGQDFIRYHVQIAPTEDTYYQNNDLFAFTEVAGPPQVMMVAPADGGLEDNAGGTPGSSPLQSALEATGSVITWFEPRNIPASLSALGLYDSLVLQDVNAKALSPRQMETIQQYIRDLGGGLVVIGGPHSYGMGGYFQTPLERTLPVNMQIKDQERFPAIGIALVLDRSGSMAQEEGGFTKMQLAGEGAVRAIQLLNDFDEVSIIPVDTEVRGQIGPLPAVDKEAIIAQIRELEVGGGGVYVRTALDAAAMALEQSENPVRHIVLLADGSDAEEKEGVPELITDLASRGISVSMVSIGEGPDTEWLKQMAELGNGRFHLTDQAANLPQIFAQETVSIQRNYLIEEEFLPILVNQSPILAGITDLPSLLGYVGTAPKETSQVILSTHQGDPLLATWQYGLGRVVAWTSDATNRWATDWVEWQGFPRFWGQVLEWTHSGEIQNLVEMAIDYENGQALLTADLLDESQNYMNDLVVEANVVHPNGQTEPLILPQNGPGRYEASFNPEEEGVYLIRLVGTTGDGQVVVGQTTGWTLGYSPEYRDLQRGPEDLLALAEISGGRDLSGASAQELATAVFAHDLPALPVRRPVWTWLILLALILFPLDVAVRRLVINREDLVIAWNSSIGRLATEKPAEKPAEEPVSRLFAAKKRIQKKSVQPPDGSPPRSIIEDPAVETNAVEHPNKPELEGQDPSQLDEKASLASRLLKKKQERDQDS